MRIGICLALACATTLACDATVTELDEIDGDLLAQVVRISGGTLTPGERVLVDLVRRADSGNPAGLRIPQIDSLFTLVVEDRSSDWADRADVARGRHQIVMAEAWRQIESGSMSEGERSLVDARAIQTATVAERLGKAGALGYIALISRSLERSGERLGSTGSRRLRAMLNSALDLRDDAQAALRDGRLPDAFDLASHAAGLANGLASGSARD